MKADEIYKLMKEKGQRITRQKKVILSVLVENQKKPLTVNEVLQLLPSTENINTATVYRNIQNLMQVGVLESLVNETGVTKYVIKCIDEHHHHLICLECGKMIPIKCNTKIFNDITRGYNFEESYHTLEIYGICEECVKSKKSE